MAVAVVAVVVLGPGTAGPVAGVTGAGTGEIAEVVASGCAHCIGVVVGGVEGEAISGVVVLGESCVFARGLRPRLAAVV